MRKEFTFILLLMTFYTIVFCQQNSKYGGGIVYGPNAAFQIYAPNNWILDNNAGMQYGLPCVLYLINYNWSNSPVIMYAKIASTNYEKIEGFIDFSLQEFKNRDSTFSHKRIKDFVTKDKFNVTINDYVENNHKVYERVAYIQVKNAVCYIVFNSTMIEDFNKYADDIFKVIDTFEYKPEYINYENRN